MKTLACSTSACRVCRYYQPEGRRGGMCQQLGVPVSANWKACSLAVPAFAPSWESIKEILQNEKLILKEALSVTSSTSCSKPHLPEDKSLASSERLKTEVVLA